MSTRSAIIVIDLLKGFFKGNPTEHTDRVYPKACIDWCNARGR